MGAACGCSKDVDQRHELAVDQDYRLDEDNLVSNLMLAHPHPNDFIRDGCSWCTLWHACFNKY